MRIEELLQELIYLFPGHSSTLKQAVTQKLHCKMRHQELVQVWSGPWGIIALRIMEITRNWDHGQKHLYETVWKAERVALVSSPPWVLQNQNTGNVEWNNLRVFTFKKTITSPDCLSLGYLAHCSTNFWVWLSIWIICCSRGWSVFSILNASTILPHKNNRSKETNSDLPQVKWIY